MKNKICDSTIVLAHTLEYHPLVFMSVYKQLTSLEESHTTCHLENSIFYKTEHK